MIRQRWGWVILLLLLAHAELGSSKQRNDSSRALKKLLIRRRLSNTSTSKQRNDSSRALKKLLIRRRLSNTSTSKLSNPLLHQLAISNNNASPIAIGGRIDQILAMPRDSKQIDLVEIVSTDIHHSGDRRALKMGSSSKGQTGRYRKRRYHSGKGKEKKEKSGMKGKGMSKGEGSSKYGGKSGSGKSGGGSGSLHDICAGLDFGSFYGVDYSVESVFGGGGKSGKGGKGKGGKSGEGKSGKGKSGKGKSEAGKSGKSWRGRSLQFDGELCSPNALEVARMDPDLSIFVDLVEAVNLSDIFLCAVSVRPSTCGLGASNSSLGAFLRLGAVQCSIQRKPGPLDRAFQSSQRRISPRNDPVPYRSGPVPDRGPC
jgi:hypothetical protein